MTKTDLRILQAVPACDEVGGATWIVHDRYLLVPIDPKDRLQQADQVCPIPKDHSYKAIADTVPNWFAKRLEAFKDQGLVELVGQISYVSWWKRTPKAEEILQTQGLPIRWEM